MTMVWILRLKYTSSNKLGSYNELAIVIAVVSFLAQQGLDIHKLSRIECSNCCHKNLHHPTHILNCCFHWRFSRWSGWWICCSIVSSIWIQTFTCRAILGVDIVSATVSTIPAAFLIVVHIITIIVSKPLRSFARICRWWWRGRSCRTITSFRGIWKYNNFWALSNEFFLKHTYILNS